MTEDWEQCFLPLDHPHAITPRKEREMVHCACCKTLLPNPDQAVRSDVWNGRGYVTYYYCNDECKFTWYLRQLYTLGV